MKPNEVRYQQFYNEFVPNLSIIDVLMFNPQNRVIAYFNYFTFSFQKIIFILNDITKKIKDAADGVADGSDQISEASQSLADGATDQSIFYIFVKFLACVANNVCQSSQGIIRMIIQLNIQVSLRNFFHCSFNLT